LHQPRAATSGSTPLLAGPDATWSAGVRRAPDFSLVDQHGERVSLARFRGRSAIVTFIDPLCRNLCPIEAKVIDAVEAHLPASARPVVLAVSVNQWGNKRSYLLDDVTKWKLTRDWHWAVGAPAALRKVWSAYRIGVQDAPKTIAGVTVHNISHTEAAYVVDPHGYERALYLYPFAASDVERTVRQLSSA
jgi:protein SCO1